MLLVFAIEASTRWFPNTEGLLERDVVRVPLDGCWNQLLQNGHGQLPLLRPPDLTPH